jgi:hypothetical protein
MGCSHLYCTPMQTSFTQSIASISLLTALGYALPGCAGTPVPTSDSTQESGAKANPAAGGDATTTYGSAPAKTSQGVTTNCEPDATQRVGPYRYNNNQWGSNKAKGKAEQCLVTRQFAGHTEYGWSWNWPGFDASVFSYPEIEFGWKPWTGGKSTDSRLPRKVKDLPRLALAYEVETVANGSYNLAPEVWLVDGPPTSELANPKSITTEVMFWMDYATDARPAGKMIDKPIIDGIEYELWKEDSIGKDANGKGWVLLSFKSPTIQHKGTISIDTLLKHLARVNQVNPNDYLASVEFGNEVMGGSGTTWVKRFEIELGTP